MNANPTTKKPALIIVDVQDAIDHFSSEARNNPLSEVHIAELLSVWRAYHLPVIHVRHSSKNKTSPYNKNSAHFGFKNEVLPIEGETIITKEENSSFTGTDLDDVLKQSSISEIVVCGVLTNDSVDSTVRIGAALGYTIFVPRDLTIAFGIANIQGRSFTPEEVHEIFLKNLDVAYCHVCDSLDLIKWARSKA